MNVIRDAAPARAELALAMLPGAACTARDVVERGFVRAVRDRGLPAEIAVVDARFDHYLDGGVVAALGREAVAPARARGLPLWLMGISLGGLGALACARAHPGEIEGVVLLAPFVGTRGLIAEVGRAGGLREWRAENAAGDPERELLAWLQAYRPGDPGWPAIHVGYGTGDRYAPAAEMIAALLPQQRRISVPGGHDWATWLVLWERMLDAGAPPAKGDSPRPVPGSARP